MVEQLALASGDDVLEIGCGRGVAAGLVCDRLGTGTYTGIDRSTVAIEAAVRANAEHVTSGRATFHTTSLADADLDERRYDTMFAAHVNLFWTRSPAPELAVVDRLLRPAGALHLCYEPLSPDQLSAVADKVTANVAPLGYDVSTRTGKAGGRAQLMLTLAPCTVAPDTSTPSREGRDAHHQGE